MQQEKSVINENEISYELLELMKEHAKKYDYESDKKAFLKSISPYEQKLVLLESKNPYEVLKYLDELDLKKSRLILSQLNFSEISKILGLFSSEDKKQFYATFSDLDLVNRFIVYDKNAPEHIENLSMDRKVDLLNSSDPETVLASSMVYKSIDIGDRQAVIQNVSTADGMSALNEVTSSVEPEVEVENVNTSEEEQEIKEEGNPEEKTEEKAEKEENKESVKVENKENIMNEFIKSRIEHYKKIMPQLENIDINDISYALLSPEMQEIIANDFETIKREKTEEMPQQQEQSKIVEFQQAKETCEQELISQVLNNMKEDLIAEVPKTL